MTKDDAMCLGQVMRNYFFTCHFLLIMLINSIKKFKG